MSATLAEPASCGGIGRGYARIGEVTIVLVLGHVVAGAIWLGSMVYSLFVVQPRTASFFAADDDAREGFLTLLAGGNRWPVFGIIAALATTGLALLALDPPSDAGFALQMVKGIALIAATIVFVYVSWRMWPRRVFALPAERPAHRRALRRAAYSLLALVGLAFALGIVSARIG